MPLQADQAVDRRSLKRQLTFWRIATIVTLVIAAIAATSRFAQTVGRDHIARLNVIDIIFSDPERDTALADLIKADSAKALIIDINSPGGTVVGGEALYRALRRVAEKKPVVAVMRETATSAAYMAALAADYIVAYDGTVTGSVGVLLQTADLTELMKKIGIKPESVKSSPLKAQPNPMEPFSDEARQVTKELIADLHAMFIDLVAERRKLPRTDAVRLSDGRIYTGRQAKENGLVDALGGEPQARKWLAETHGIEEDLPLKEMQIEREQPLWRRLFEESGGKALFSERLRLDGLVSVWHPSFK